MNNRTKTLLIVAVLTQQLRVWVKHARDLGHMTKDFKYLSGIILNALDRFHRYLFGDHPDEDEIVYEHSVTVSELVEKMLNLDDNDLRRVTNLVDKITLERKSKCDHDYIEKFGVAECQNCGKQAA